ncbi:hypothetical protein BC835DRAFT_1408516 [Cytidiella melzeri]|nr:hypothetical protein BC835DRAFT_1408516 [Cytidiella melzeri]
MSATGMRKNALRDIAASTLDAIQHGSYLQHDLTVPVAFSKQHTEYYPPDSLLSGWSTSESRATHHNTRVLLLEVSTLDGARLLGAGSSPDLGVPTSTRKIGVLNFASAKKPGGGFINGAQAQEESIARSSTLYPTLMTSTAQQFYTLHNRDAHDGYYSHAMIYSPRVVIFRDDQGGWTDPLEVDVLTSPAVNAGVVRQKCSDSGDEIEEAMTERMSRILFLFERQGAQDLVLGSFGTGVFRNDVGMVARIWTELLLSPGARFKQSFESVVFAVLGTATFEKFQEVFSHYDVS